MRRKWSDEFLPVGPWETKAQAEAAQYEYDITICEARIQRAMSDKVHGFRVCPEKTCRRARRCVGSFICHELCRLSLTAEQEAVAVGHLYEVVTANRALARRSRARGPA